MAPGGSRRKQASGHSSRRRAVKRNSQLPRTQAFSRGEVRFSLLCPSAHAFEILLSELRTESCTIAGSDDHGRAAAVFARRKRKDHAAVVILASKIEAPDLENALEALLDGRPIRPAETKAFACAIQRN